MKYLSLFFFISLSLVCYGQEIDDSECAIILINPRVNLVMTDISDDGNYLIRLYTIETKNSYNYEVGLFKWDGVNYKKKLSFPLEARILKKEPDFSKGFLSSEVQINNSGEVVILFNNIFDLTNSIAIFDSEFNLKKIIYGEDLGYAPDEHGCQENNPWVCWFSPFSFEDNVLGLYTQHNQFIEIDIYDGNYEKSKSEYCP